MKITGGTTPMNYACEGDDFRVIQKLIDLGYKVCDKEYRNKREVYNYLIKNLNKEYIESYKKSSEFNRVCQDKDLEGIERKLRSGNFREGEFNEWVVECGYNNEEVYEKMYELFVKSGYKTSYQIHCLDK